ncbi:O-antigen/lipopolysaccharide transport ATP-binding protein ABC transporter RfbE [Mycobacteroides abscessus subsp. abscessus]|nr:O-antigen/lipopolysaccharide transport ATP-binding protein ABC transporter RfbE [Mycobacteroides abscessus subsp. abscessus]
MVEKPKVYFHNVSKKYTLQQKKIDKIKELFLLRDNANHNFFALKNVSFTVNEGETIGVIGINGSGKSTLSNILAQVIPPTSGEVKINGETSLIAISVGLNNNLTGIENIELKCLMQGLTKEEIKHITPLIVEFAELGIFINQPVKSYSSGMKSRLGFAISAHTDPDIMVVDEALSVGDQTFYEKCIKKMNQFKKEGKTIFFISHSASQIRNFCDRTMWIHHGELVEFGETKEVLGKYSKFIKDFNSLTDEEKAEYKREKMALRQVDEFEKIPSTTRRRRMVKESKTKGKGPVGLAILSILFVLSAALMIFTNGAFKGLDLFGKDDPASSKQVEGKSKANETKVDKLVLINKNGYIADQSVTVYSSKELSEEFTTLTFADRVYVESSSGNVSQIKIDNGVVGYVNNDYIFIPSETGTSSNTDIISNVLPGLPNAFVDSYQYYLAFLSSDQETIESRLLGKTGEESVANGTYLIFDKVKYHINDEKISNQLIISDFVPQNVDVERLLLEASFTNKDNEILYVVTNEYGYVINLKDNSVSIRRLESF